MDINEKNKEMFSEYPIPRALASMAVPTIIGQLIILIYNLADTYWVGRTNNPTMVAGASLILPYFTISIAFAGLAGVGGGSLIARLLGKGELKDAKKVASFSIYLSVVIALLFSLFTFLFMTPVLNLLGATEETFSYAKDYAFYVIVIGALPSVLSQCMANILRCVGFSKKAGFGITMGGIINMILDPIFMFLLLPSGYEIVGAGIATLVSNILSCLYFFYAIYRVKSPVISLSPRMGFPQKEYILSIFSVGFPNALNTFLWDMNCIVLNKLMAGYGSAAIAAVGIVLKAERLPISIGIGLSQGMMPIVAYNYSARNKKRTIDTIKYARAVGVLFGIACIALYELFAPAIIGFFINNEETIRSGAIFLRVRALATPLMFLCFFHTFIFQGFGKGSIATRLSLLRFILLNIPLLIILNHFFGQMGLVFTQVSADTVTVALSLLTYYRFKKKELDTLC
ncbi:MAG: MATE family efflux transporter [Spirochaetales bacterium]|nr:MATE family efflux transporter [Candidatus Physcosoma equi]